MPTVIDELVLQIGLDGSKFAEGRRALDDEMAKGRASVETFGKTVEEQGTKISEAFAFAKRGAAGILATFVGGEAAQFIDHIATMDAHTNRLAQSINMTTRELSVWQNMVRGVGGSPGDVNALFGGVNDAFMGMVMGNQMPSAPFASLLSRSGVDPRRSSADAALRQIMTFLSGQPEQLQRFWLNQIPGMNEGSMFLMMDIIRNPDKMRAFREEIEKIGVASDQSAAEARELQKNTAELDGAMENLGRVGIPVLTRIVNALADGIQRIIGTTKDMEEHPFAPPSISVIPGGPADRLWGWLTDPRPRSLGDLFSSPAAASTGPSGSAGGAAPSRAEVEAYIRKSAISQNIDPDQAVRVAMGETGLNAQAIGDKGTSFGVFQLHYGGLAEAYERLTKHKVSDFRYWQDQVDFSMAAARSQGWTPWHAWRGSKWQGIGAQAPAAAGKQSSVTITGGIHITSNKADPKAVADEIPAAIGRSSRIVGMNTGLV